MAWASLRSVLLAGLLVLVGAGAFAACPAAASVEIVSPGSDVLKHKRAVDVKVRVRGPGTVTAFTRRPHNRDITSRFRPASGRVRVARLRGGDLAIGANHVFVRQISSSGKVVGNDEVHFTVGRKAAGAIRVSGIHRREHGSVDVRVKPRGVDTLRARLNGRNVSGAFVRRPDGAAGKPRRPWVGSLSARHGLRFGRNRLVITGFDPQGGRYARLRREFTISSARPLLTAGRDVTGSRKAPIPLAGRAKSAAGRSAPKLSWRIVKRPRGADAVLRDRRTGQPTLIARDTGHYTIEARASQAARRQTKAAPAATDTVTVTAQPEHLPSGVPIQTIVSTSSPSVVVGGDTYAMDSPAESWVQMVVLDRATLTEVSNTTYPGGTALGQIGIGQLISDLQETTSDQLVIVSGGGGAGVGATDEQLGQLAGALQSVGASFDEVFGNLDDLQAGDLSLVGVPGMLDGNAHDLIGDSLGGSSPPGAMTGLLQLDAYENYAFNWPFSNLTFDTHADASTDQQNVIQIGDQTYASETVANDGTECGVSGSCLQIVWLDAVSGEFQGNETQPVTLDGIGALIQRLYLLDNDQSRTAILIHSIGHPSVDEASPNNFTNNWAVAADLLAEFGANRYLFAGLDGSGGYSFVGVEGLPETDGVNAGTEFAQSQNGSDTYVGGSDAARIVGLLQPNEQATLTSAVNTTAQPNDENALDFEINPLLVQPDQPFDYDFSSRPARFKISDQAIAQAQSFIVSDKCDPTAQPPQTVCGGLELSKTATVDPTFGIRALYWTDTAIDWGTEANSIKGLDPKQGLGCRGACVKAFEYLRGDFVRPSDHFQGLSTEFDLVGTVVDYFVGGGDGSLSQVLELANTDSNNWFTSVSGNILQFYDPPPQAPSGPDVLNLVLGSGNVIGGALGAVPTIGGALSAPSKIAGGVVQIIQAAQTTPGGLPANDPLNFHEDINGWGSHILTTYQGQLTALSTVSDLLVSDQGRLFEAAANITQPPGGDSWQLSKDSDLQFQLAASVGRYLYASMLPVPALAVLCDRASAPAAAESGAYEASLANDDVNAIEEDILFLVNAAGGVPALLGADEVTTLFGPAPTQGTPTPEGPLGFWKPLFMSGAPQADLVPGTGGFTYASADSNNIACSILG